MRMYDIITKKKHGEALSEAEIRFFIDGFTKGDIPDYQISSLMMAICLCGMNDEETAILTDAITHSGDTLDLSRFGTLSVDKHSTGGVGDKTTLVVAPLVAAAGAKVAKMSGRGLGHTGGTVDKLESFSGFRTTLSADEFLSQVENIGIAVIGQSGELAPADKKLYALRDVTATVDSIPLITSSIMGKKLAAGSHSIVLDVKYGSGGFMKTPEDAERLARAMVAIGTALGRNVAALITNMDAPLGLGIGNVIEVEEAREVLRGRGPADLREVCLSLATMMLHLSLGLDRDQARTLAENTLSSGAAIRKFNEWISAQGGNPDLPLPHATHTLDILAQTDGYLAHVNAEAVGVASVTLGGGRITKTDPIDYTAGIILHKKVGDTVKRGDVLATLYTTEKENALPHAKSAVLSAMTFSAAAPDPIPLIYKIITKESLLQ